MLLEEEKAAVGIRTHGTVTRTTVFEFYDSLDGLCRCVAKRVHSFGIFIASISSHAASCRAVMHSWFAIWFANFPAYVRPGYLCQGLSAIVS